MRQVVSRYFGSKSQFFTLITLRGERRVRVREERERSKYLVEEGRNNKKQYFEVKSRQYFSHLENVCPNIALWFKAGGTRLD